ncbi:Unknown protein [Striga hermonthica]|uniref:Reverse transcriptase zinc-binding domain-containing protein n=1 Tax=Striga hermonthica TaxID=68872 RepID=A0A9N7MJ65_STRHE|nr:Unknown protein [Striga hermonthica]
MEPVSGFGTINKWLHSDVTLGQVSLDTTIPEQQHYRTVADFRSETGHWRWESFSHLLPATYLLQVASRPPPQSDGRDLIYWGHSDDGSFTTASAYHSLAGPTAMEATRIWKLIWQWEGPQRIRQFLWLVAKGRLLTNCERFRRHVAASPCCELCGGHEESIIHALRDCSGAQQLWRLFIPGIDFTNFLHMNLNDWLVTHLSSPEMYGVENWPCLFGIVAWRIWHARNSCIFNHEVFDVTQRAREIQMHRRNILAAKAHANHGLACLTGYTQSRRASCPTDTSGRS